MEILFEKFGFDPGFVKVSDILKHKNQCRVIAELLQSGFILT